MESTEQIHKQPRPTPGREITEYVKINLPSQIRHKFVERPNNTSMYPPHGSQSSWTDISLRKTEFNLD